MIISQAQLQEICVTEKGKKACIVFIPFLNEFMPKFGIDSINKVSAFLGQIMHESAEFTTLTENLNYGADGLARVWPSRFRSLDGTPNEKAKQIQRKPELIANAVYAKRMGNGDEASGDGYKYRGRGLIQLTGKSNYEAFSKSSKIDFVGNPDSLISPNNAVHSACWFWNNHGINQFAEQQDTLEVTKRINGGTVGFEERKRLTERAKKVLQGAE